MHERKEARINFTLTPEQREELEEEADYLGLTLSAYLRLVLFGAPYGKYFVIYLTKEEKALLEGEGYELC